MIKLSEKGVFLASNNEIIAEEHFTGEIKKEEAKKGTIAWSCLLYTSLALVERNEAPLGIVYGSDAVASKGVKVVATFPDDSHKKVELSLIHI